MPRIAERFPRYRDQVLRAQFRDTVFKDICRDYDSVIEALEQEETRRSLGEGSEITYWDLVRLSRELENDILRHLATRPTSQDKQT